MQKRSNYPLTCYESIVLDKKSAKFIKTRNKALYFDSKSDDTTLWQLHDEYTKKRSSDNKEHHQSLLDLKIELAERMVEKCSFCEHKCGVNRKKNERGQCKCPYESKIASEFIHMGEEAELIPSYTIFFAGCTFMCVFCQNFDISQNPNEGILIDPITIAKMIDNRKRVGAKNVNFVGGDPTPHIHTILKTIREIKENIAIVFNSNMYLSEDSMKLLDGVVDVYLTDFKYYDSNEAEKYSKIKNYFEVVSRNHHLAKNQAELIIRHLVLPNHVECCTKNILCWIKDNLGQNMRINYMFQFRPTYMAKNYSEIARRLTFDEKSRVGEIVKELDLFYASH